MADELRVIDTATPWIRSMMLGSPDWKRKALKSVGWMIAMQIKKGIRSGAPGGQAYAAPIPIGVRQKIDAAFNLPPRQRYPILNKLAAAVGYQWHGELDAVEIGWTSASAVRIGSLQEEGFTRQVTPAMRGAFAEGGDPLKASTQELVIPARPTYGPMYRVVEPLTAPYLQQKLEDYATNPPPVGAAKPSRSYVVFGR